MNPLEVIAAAKSMRAVSYTDEMSAEKCSFKDLQIGYDNCTVGCNSAIFGSSTTGPGDLIIIMAKKNKKLYMNIGVLGERLESCTLWRDQGGHEWKYNFQYKPLTQIFEVTDTIRNAVIDIAVQNSCKTTTFFNSRFCSIKLRPIVHELFAQNIIEKSVLARQ